MTACLRIVHINTVAGRGGAALAAGDLMRAQCRRGQDASMLVAAVYGNHPQTTVVPVTKDGSAGAADLYLDIVDCNDLLDHRTLRAADIVHLHNTHGDYFNPFWLTRLCSEHPVVWTLHDMHAFTGRCINSLDCERWRNGCGHCPHPEVPPVTLNDRSAEMWQLKREIASKVTVRLVTPSRWLAQRVAVSFLGDKPLTVIQNGVDEVTFQPADRTASRRRLGLPADGLYVGFVADRGIDTPLKGGEHVPRLAKTLRDRLGARLVTIGGTRREVDGDGILHLPHAFKPRDMATFYNSLDALVSLSSAENCPLSLLESLACGVPVVAFRVGGVGEIICDGANGRLVDPGDVPAVAQACADVFRIHGARREAVRGSVVPDHSVELTARRYDSVYLQAIRAHLTPRFVSGRPLPSSSQPRHD